MPTSLADKTALAEQAVKLKRKGLSTAEAVEDADLPEAMRYARGTEEDADLPEATAYARSREPTTSTRLYDRADTAAWAKQQGKLLDTDLYQAEQGAEAARAVLEDGLRRQGVKDVEGVVELARKGAITLADPTLAHALQQLDKYTARAATNDEAWQNLVVGGEAGRETEFRDAAKAAMGHPTYGQSFKE